jgi:hypothetical protein
MKMLKFMYIGRETEVQINSPYKQKFKPGEKVEVTREMADVLRTHPEFREIEKRKDMTPREELEGMFDADRKGFLKAHCSKLGWDGFQKWADKEFGVKDTSKDELMEEILNKLREG